MKMMIYRSLKSLMNTAFSPDELHEYNTHLNKISRSIIRVMKREKGSCWLGCWNQASLIEYKKGMVYNFQYNFCVPKNDPELIELLSGLESKTFLHQFDPVFKRIQELEGCLLIWV